MTRTAPSVLRRRRLAGSPPLDGPPRAPHRAGRRARPPAPCSVCRPVHARPRGHRVQSRFGLYRSSWSRIPVDAGYWLIRSPARVVDGTRRSFGNATHVALDGTFDRTVGRLLSGVFTVLEQILEQGAIVDHRLAQVLRRRRAATVTLGNVARAPIVVDHGRVVDREVGRAPIEIADRIAACLHDFFDQRVGTRYRATRIVHEQ